MKRKLLSILICLAMLSPCSVFGAQGDSSNAGTQDDPAAVEKQEDPAAAELLEDLTQIEDQEESSLTEEEQKDAALTQEQEEPPAAEEPEQSMLSEDPEASALEDLIVAYNNRGRETSFESIDESSYDGFLYVLKDNTSKKDLQEMNENIEALNAEQGTDPEDPCVEEVARNEIYAADSLEDIEAVADPENIEYIEPNYVRQLASMPREGSINNKNTNNYRLIDVDLLWDYGITGKGVKVAVIDTGVVGLKGGKVKHQDLNYKKISRGTTYSYKKVRLRGGLYTWKRYKGSYANDDNGHGTFVTGEIVAKKNNKKGVTGMAPGVNIISIKVSNKQGMITDADSIKALKLAKKKGAKVVNMSIAGPDYSSSVQNACDELASKNILIIAAAGNNGTSAYSYPASYSSVISVGAVMPSGVKTSYSQYNNRIDCAAPGNFYGISKSKKNKYRYMSGTSMATPVVTSFAAIVKSIKPRCTVSEFRTILSKTCTDQGASGKDNLYGYGIVNFRNMYKYLRGTLLYPKSGSIARLYASIGGTSFQYTGKAIKPSCSIDYLTYNTDYTVTYANNTEVGTATVTFQGKGKYTGTLKKNFKIVPAPTRFTTYKTSGLTMTPYWNAQTTQTTGYQLRIISTTKKNKIKYVYRYVTPNTATSYTIKNTSKKKIFSHGKAYLVSIRTYKKVNGKYYYSSWSTNTIGHYFN